MSNTEVLKQVRETDRYVRELLPNAEKKVAAIMKKAESSVTEILNNRDVIGKLDESGTSRMRVFQGLLIGRPDPDSGNALYTGSGGFAAEGADINANSTGSVWLHFKLPWVDALVPAMFHLHITGYLYGQADFLDEVLVGYAYHGKKLLNHRAEGRHEPLLYRGSDGFIYARIKIKSAYFATVAIDSMKVGVGRALKLNELVVTVTSDKEKI